MLKKTGKYYVRMQRVLKIPVVSSGIATRYGWLILCD